jgi:hypothetical protein
VLIKSRPSGKFRPIYCVAIAVLLIFIPTLTAGKEELHDREKRKGSLTNQPGNKAVFDLSIRREGIGFGPGKNLVCPTSVDSTGGEEFITKKHFWRALLETSGLLAIFQIKYKKTHTERVEGVHKYYATWKDQKEKIFNWKNWNYDANCFDLNWQHALAGGVYYNFSRSNNLNVLESFLMSWASSSYWEFVVEYRSDVSINDHIFTPLGGLSVGEAWYQLGKFFAGRSDALSQVLSFLNPILKLNTFLDRKKTRDFQSDPQPGWHEFTIDLGFRNLRIKKDDYSHTTPYAGIQTQIMHIPEYGHPGSDNRLVKQPLFSEIQMNMTGLGRSAEEYNLFSRVVLFGYFRQNIDSLNRGYSLYLGGASAFSMFKKKTGTTNFPCSFKGRNPDALKLDEPRDFADKLATVHIIGPVFDWTRFGKNFRIRLVMDMYADFGIVNSFAFNAYSRQFDFSGVKTPLLVNGYYYGWGTSLSSRLDISWRNVNLQTYLKYQSYGSIEGKDRFQPLVTDDFHLADSRFLSRLTFGYRISGLPLMMKAVWEGIYRRGRIEDLDEKTWEVRGFLGLALVF